MCNKLRYDCFSDPPRSGGATRSGETESEDAKSTGSWSIYSDSPKNGPRRAASNTSLATAVAAAAVASVSDDDVTALLAKIEALQTDKFGGRQRRNRPERSACNDLKLKPFRRLHAWFRRYGQFKFQHYLPHKTDVEGRQVDGGHACGLNPLRHLQATQRILSAQTVRQAGVCAKTKCKLAHANCKMRMETCAISWEDFGWLFLTS